MLYTDMDDQPAVGIMYPGFEGATIEQVVDFASTVGHGFVFPVDAVAIAHPEHAVLVIDTDEQPGRYFRVLPSMAWAVENNLSLVFRRFPAGDD